MATLTGKKVAILTENGFEEVELTSPEKDVEFAQHFLETGKPVAAICHGPQLLIETGLIDGRNMTSYWSLQTDMENAGVIWEDKEVIADNGLVTSRSPKDLEAFNKKMIEEIREGEHAPSAY